VPTDGGDGMSDRIEEQIRLGVRLVAEEVRAPFPTRRPTRPSRRAVGFALGLALLITGVALGTLGGSSAPPSGLGSLGVGSLATVDRPIPGLRVSLAQATDVLGAPLILPDLPGVSSADIGAVWSSRAAHSSIGESVAVTFPSQGFAVRYTRPVPYKDALVDYESYVRSTPSAQVVYLDGVPTLTDTSRRADGSSWSFVEFVSHGTMIAVMGTADEPTLQDAAQSILTQAGS